MVSTLECKLGSPINSLMAKRKKKKVTTTKKYIRGRDLGEVRHVGAELEPYVDDAIKEYCKSFGVKKRFVIESALKDWLIRKGMQLTPPPIK